MGARQRNKDGEEKKEALVLVYFLKVIFVERERERERERGRGEVVN